MTPSLWYTLLGSDVDWGYSSVPQPGLDGRKTYEPRGKLPGGSSNLYIMMHIRGHPRTTTAGPTRAAPAGPTRTASRTSRSSENQDDDTSPSAGKGGPIPVTTPASTSPNPTSAGLHRGLHRARLSRDRRLQRPEHGRHRLAPHQRRRRQAVQQPSAAYLEPALGRPNLTFQTECARLEPDLRGRPLHRRRVHPGWQPDAPGAHATAARSSSAAGAIESPKLLLLSGIGDPGELKAARDRGRRRPARRRQELPQPRPDRASSTKCTQPVPPGNQNLSESALFLKSDPGGTGPDLQIAFVHVPFNIIVGQGHPNSVSILPGVVRPLSRGWIKLASTDPTAQAAGQPELPRRPSDRERLVKASSIAARHLRAPRRSRRGSAPS